MKILIVTETLEEGGAELFVLRLAKALQAGGEQIDVLSLNKQYENKEMTEKFKDLSIKRFSLPFLSLIEFTDKLLARLHIDFSIKYYWQGKKLKRIAGEYDIVHSHYIQADYLIASIKKKYSFRHVVTVHGDYSAQFDSFQKGELRFWLRLDRKMRFLEETVDQWVVIADEQKIFLKKEMSVTDDCIAKIYNGYFPPENEVVPARNTEHFTVGMVARGVEKKGWQKLIDAFLKLPADSLLLLVGGGDYIDLLKEKYSGQKRIVFTGFTPSPLAYICQMDVFVLPTLFPYESLPNVITEALYCNVPVIATDIGEIGKMITDEVTGKNAGFVIPFDGTTIDEGQLYEKLYLIYTEPVLRKEMSEVAKKAFEKFEMNKCTNAYRKLFNKLLS